MTYERFSVDYFMITISSLGATHLTWLGRYRSIEYPITKGTTAPPIPVNAVMALVTVRSIRGNV